jgi:hypothetical protein
MWTSQAGRSENARGIPAIESTFQAQCIAHCRRLLLDARAGTKRQAISSSTQTRQAADVPAPAAQPGFQAASVSH